MEKVKKSQKEMRLEREAKALKKNLEKRREQIKAREELKKNSEKTETAPRD